MYAPEVKTNSAPIFANSNESKGGTALTSYPRDELPLPPQVLSRYYAVPASMLLTYYLPNAPARGSGSTGRIDNGKHEASVLSTIGRNLYTKNK